MIHPRACPDKTGVSVLVKEFDRSVGRSRNAEQDQAKERIRGAYQYGKNLRPTNLMLADQAFKSRRLLISIAGAVARPNCAQKSQSIVYLESLACGHVSSSSRAFLDMLRYHRWIFGRNLIIEGRFTASEESYEKAAAGPEALFGVGAPDVAALATRAGAVIG